MSQYGRKSFRTQSDPQFPGDVFEYGAYQYPCEGQMIFKCLDVDKMPKFGAPVYLENKTMIGKVEEIFGNVATPYFVVKPNEGYSVDSFKENGKCYITADKTLPSHFFLEENNKPKAGRGGGRGGRGGGRGGRGGGGRGGGRGGGSRGGSRGGGRGGSRGGGRGGSRGGGRGRGRGQ